jgi:L-ascorbate metabolism protein UlaG (beta-lactamase superfamily)
MYVSGDTLVYRDIHQIPLRYPNVDLALLHLGGTRVMGILVTMNAEQGIEAMRIVRPGLTIPIHYNDYDLFKEPLDEFMRAVAAAGWQDRVRYLSHGEAYSFAPAFAGR